MVASSLPHPFVSVVVTYALNAAWQAPLVFAGAMLSARLLVRLGPLAVAPHVGRRAAAGRSIAGLPID